MPEQNHQSSGQCGPVTEDALSQRHEARSNAASALAITQTRNQNHQNHVHQQQSRTVQSIGMVPVSATSHNLNTVNQLPPSPPSTPSQSPPEFIETSFNLISDNWTIESGKHAHQSIGTEMPDTPEASPSTISSADASLHQKLALCSREFVKKVLPNILTIDEKGRYIIEDAGMEIVSQTCVGAVLIDTKPNDALVAGSFTPGTPRIRSGTSSRMSRSSSMNSNTSSIGVGNPPPRRTLLTQIQGKKGGMNPKDLRAHTLDILDHATEKLHVDNIIFVLDRSNLDEEEFRATVHGLCYVGASIIGHGLRDNEQQNHESSLVEGGDPNEFIHSPRCVGRNLVLLSVDA